MDDREEESMKHSKKPQVGDIEWKKEEKKLCEQLSSIEGTVVINRLKTMY